MSPVVGREFGDTAEYRCDPGYLKRGPGLLYRSCLASGVWSDSNVHCERKLIVFSTYTLFDRPVSVKIDYPQFTV